MNRQWLMVNYIRINVVESNYGVLSVRTGRGYPRRNYEGEGGGGVIDKG